MRHLLDTKIGDYQAMVPMVDIDTIGAGGGSIAYVDQGGVFRVGPSRPVPTRAQHVTGAAGHCRPPRTRSSCWAASAPTAGSSVGQWISTATSPSKQWAHLRRSSG